MREEGNRGGGAVGQPLQPGPLTPDGGQVSPSGHEALHAGLRPLQTGAPTGPRVRPHPQRTGPAHGHFPPGAPALQARHEAVTCRVPR